MQEPRRISTPNLVWRTSAACIALVGLVAVAPALASLHRGSRVSLASRALRSDSPRRRGLSAGLTGSGPHRERVLISLAASPVQGAAMTASQAFGLSGRLTSAEAAALRRGRQQGRTFAVEHARLRAGVLGQLGVAASEAARSQRGVVRAIRRADGELVESDPLSNSLTAILPGTALAEIARRPDVWAVSPAPRARPMGGLANETRAMGAPTWWVAGYTGGSGTAPDGIASLAILNDKIQEDQPLFQGVGFERPQSAPLNPPVRTSQRGL